jgi:hypothetical protein
MHKITLAFLALATLLASGCSESSSGYYEDEAINALDATTETIGNLNAVSLRIFTYSNEVVDGQTATHQRESDVYLSGGNKLHIYSKFDDERKGFWYNGSELAVFRFDEGVYDEVAAPPTTIQMIDSMHQTFKMDFPAADVFYPTLTDDILTYCDTVLYLSPIEVDGVECKQVYAASANFTVYLSLAETSNLPMQLELYGRGERAGEEYIANYTDWQLNPDLPEEMFKFSPPANATKATIFKQH